MAALRTRLAHLAYDRGLLIGLATLVLYIWIAPAHIVDGDNGEFATLSAIGGIAHPSGYPLYLLWLHAMAWLPAENPAHAAAIATAILGAISIVVLHAACRAWGAKPLAATVAVALFAAGPVVLRIETEAEVFALNGLVVAGVLWLAALEGPWRGVWRAFALGLVAGLGISDHLTCVLVAPVGILGVVRAAREASAWKTVAVAIAGLALGLTPYAYALVAADTPMSWGHVRSLDDLFGLITRRDYGGAGNFLATGESIPITTSIWAMAMTIGRAWLWLPAVLGLATLGVRIVRRGEGETRWGWATIGASWLLAGPVLASRFNVEPVDLGLYVVQRFHVLPAMLLAIPIAVGLGAIAKPFASRVQRLAHVAPPIVATLGFAAVAGLSLPHILRTHTPAIEESALNILRSLPPNAVVIEIADDIHFGAGYAQWVLGVRQDVVMVAWSQLPMKWYRDRVGARGIVAPDGPAPLSFRVTQYLLSIGRPVFVDPNEIRIVKMFPTHPYGPLIRVLPRGSKQPTLEEVFELNKQLYAKFELDYPRPGYDDEFATAIHERYAATWYVLGRALAAAGKIDDAAWANEAAREIGPQP